MLCIKNTNDDIFCPNCGSRLNQHKKAFNKIWFIIPLSLAAILFILFCFFSLYRTPEEKKIDIAIDALTEFWCDKYDINEDDIIIRDIRVVTPKNNEQKILDDVECIIEFVIYVKGYYFESDPYPCNMPINNNVVFYKNGDVNVESNVMQSYAAYAINLKEIVRSVKDYDVDKYVD